MGFSIAFRRAYGGSNRLTSRWRLGNVIRQRSNAGTRSGCRASCQFTQSLTMRQKADCAIYASWQGKIQMIIVRSRAHCRLLVHRNPRRSDPCQAFNTCAYSGPVSIPPVVFQQLLTASAIFSLMSVDRTALNPGNCFPRILFQESGYNMSERFIENDDQLC